MRLTRRRALRLFAASGAGALVAACGGAASPTAAPKPTEAPKAAAPTVAPTTVSATSKPAAAATTAPAATAPASARPAAGGADPAAAQKEGKVVVYSTTDSASAEPLLKEFRARYAGVQVEYNDLNSTELYNRFTSEAAAGAPGADVTWSSAMDLQLKLVKDGLAETYASPEASGLPEWARFKDQAYGTTLEPFAFIYNKRLVPDDTVPGNHDDFARILNEKADRFKGMVTSYDPEKSGTGYLAMNQDARHYPKFWDLARAFGKVDLKVYTSTGSMIEKVRSGEHSLGYDIIGSYVLPVMKKDQNMGLALPKDFTVAFSRIAFVAAKAPRPNAGKLFLDYLLSKQGQETMSTQSLLYAIRSDVQGDVTAAGLKKALGDALKPIAVSESLLDNLDQAKRQEFFNRWKQAMGR